MIQRNIDPDNSDEEDRDVYGFFVQDWSPSQDPFVYRIIGNASTGDLDVVERINVPSPYIQTY